MAARKSTLKINQAQYTRRSFIAGMGASAAAFYLSGCGGGSMSSPTFTKSMPPPAPAGTPAAAPIILPAPTPPRCLGRFETPLSSGGCSLMTSDQAFVNKPAIWVFKNGYGDETTVEVITKDPTHCTFHYTKHGQPARAYWGIGGLEAELYFDLEQDEAGAWYNTSGRVLFPFGSPWDHTPNQDFTYSVVAESPNPRPYLIIPARSDAFSLETTFRYSTPGSVSTYWETVTGIESVDTPVYTGPALISRQREGPFILENWDFAPGLGLVAAQPLDEGDGKGLDPLLAMVRVS